MGNAKRRKRRTERQGEWGKRRKRQDGVQVLLRRNVSKLKKFIEDQHEILERHIVPPHERKVWRRNDLAEEEKEEEEKEEGLERRKRRKKEDLARPGRAHENTNADQLELRKLAVHYKKKRRRSWRRKRKWRRKAVAREKRRRMSR